jgi:hypothetical protein
MKIFILLISLFLSCSTQQDIEKNYPRADLDFVPAVKKEEDYNEQISCKRSDCVDINYNSIEDAAEKIGDLMSKNCGKMLIRMQSYTKKLSDPELEDVVDYLREISKRDGRVSIEPYYIGERIEPGFNFSFVKDTASVGWDIFNRTYNSIKYKNTINYNAKVIYHPKSHSVMMIYIVNKLYGDVCSTVFARCQEIEYLDDDSFDLSLSTALKENIDTKRSVKVNFKQQKAKLPETNLTLENIKELNKSTRIYKWFVVSSKTEKKPEKKERFIGIQAVVSLVGYALSLYDYLKAIQLYSPAIHYNAEVYYSGAENGGEIRSVVFTQKKEDEKK